MRRPDKQGRSSLQRFRKAAPVLTLKMIPIFLMLTILVQFSSVQFSRRLDCSLISVTQAEGLPWSLSKQNQLKTLISMSPGRWHPIRLSGMKRLFQSKPLFASILVCLTNVLMPLVLMHMTVHNTLIINSIKNLNTQKALIGTEPFGGWGSPIREHKKYYSIELLLDQCLLAELLMCWGCTIKTMVNIVRNLGNKSLALVWKQ